MRTYAFALAVGLAVLTAALGAGGPAEAKKSALPSDCAYERVDGAKVVCTASTQRVEAVERVEVGGCLAGPTGAPGVRRTRYLDTYLITTETTTGYKQDKLDRVVFTRSDETRALLSSQQLERTCEPIGGAV